MNKLTTHTGIWETFKSSLLCEYFMGEGKGEKTSGICVSCECNQRQPNDPHFPQMMQLCGFVSDLFIKTRA